MYREVEKSSLYFLGIRNDALRQIQETDPGIYERFFIPPYLDELTLPPEEPAGPARKIVWLKEPDFPQIASRYTERTGVDYLQAIIDEMENSGVRKGDVRVYRQTLTVELLE